MEIALKWVVLGVGAAASMLAAVVGHRDRGERNLIPIAAFAVFSAVLLFCATIPSAAPVFAPGLRLGIGILIGGFIGSYAGLFYSCKESTPWTRTICNCGLAAFALFGTGLIFLAFGDYPQPALGGFLIGAVLSSVIFRFVLPDNNAPDIWLLSSVTLGSTSLLATYRFQTVDLRFWWMLPSMVLAATIISALAFAGLARDDRRFSLLSIITSALVLVLIAVLAWRIFPQWAVLWTAISGVLTFALVAWLGYVPRVSAVSAVLVVAFSALAFKFLGGFGIGIGMLAAFAIFFSIASSHAEMKTFNFALSITAGLLLLRLFIQTYQFDLRGLDLRAYYTFVALTLGAMMPFILVSYLSISGSQIHCRRLFGTWVYGILAAASPLLIVILWGMKASLGFLIGVLASQIIILLLNSDLTDSARSAYTKITPLMMAALVSAIIFSSLLGTLAEGPRLTKIIILAAVVLAGLIWTGISMKYNQSHIEEA